MKGNFTVRKTKHTFSSMAMDQAHEQMNEKMKGTAGLIGLTENPDAMLRWITSGPDVQRAVEEYEESFTNPSSEENLKHHEDTPKLQMRFMCHVQDFLQVIEGRGNPFAESENDLLTLETRKVMPSNVVHSARNAYKIGLDQYKKFTEERLTTCSTPVTDVIKKNNLPLFTSVIAKKPSKAKQEISSLKNSCSLFGRLYIACQSRDGDMDEFFKHENQPTPPALSDSGSLRKTAKSDLTTCLEALLDIPTTIPRVSAKVFDGSALVHMLAPGSCKFFKDYADTVFLPYIHSQLETASHIDVI